MLTNDHKMQHLMASRVSLHRYRKKGDDFLSKIVTTDETWVFHYDIQKSSRMKDTRLVCCYIWTDEEAKAAVSNWLHSACEILFKRNRQSDIKIAQVCCKGGRLCGKIKSIF